MSSFYSVAATNQSKSTSNYIDYFLNNSINSIWDIYASELARRTKAVERKHLNKPSVVMEKLKQHFSSQSASQVARLMFKNIPGGSLMVLKNEKELVRKIISQLESDENNLIALYADTADSQTRCYLWQFITLLNYLKNESQTIELVETTLEVKSLVVPEGAMPNMKSSIRWPQLISRFLRDAEIDEQKNPWLKEFGYDTLASPNWNGHPIYDVKVYNRTRKSCSIDFVCECDWLNHLTIGKSFSSAG